MSRSTLYAEPVKQETDGKKPEIILFVCTGNTCRSPMAEALFNALFAKDGRRATSAGLYATGAPISHNAARALRNRGIEPTPDNDYTAHISRTVTEEMVREADLVVGMTGNHAMELMFRFPQYASKIFTMPEDISDPYGGDLGVYEVCLGEIEEAIGKIIKNRE